MKINMIRLFAFAVIVVFVMSPMSAMAHSEEASVINSIDQGFVFPEGQTAKEIIAQVYSEYEVEMAMDSSIAPDNYWCDSEQYVLIFSAGRNFASDMSGGAEKIMAELSNTYRPYIYIPIFSRISGADRVVGHVEIYYTSEDYVSTVSVRNTNAAEFVSGEIKHFLDGIDAFADYKCVAEATGCDKISQPIIVQLSRKGPEVNEQILLVKEDDDIYVFDYMNTVHVKENDRQLVMTPEQYSELRVKYEDGLSNPIIEWLDAVMHRVFGVGVIIVAVFLIAAIVIFVVFIKMRKR